MQQQQQWQRQLQRKHYQGCHLACIFRFLVCLLSFWQALLPVGCVCVRERKVLKCISKYVPKLPNKLLNIMPKFLLFFIYTHHAPLFHLSLLDICWLNSFLKSVAYLWAICRHTTQFMALLCVLSWQVNELELNMYSHTYVLHTKA